MDAMYRIQDTSALLSPSLIFFKDLIRRNLDRAITMSGSAQRLRPHVKTHKTREIVRLELEAGVTKHKCATIAEAEMVASCGAPDVFLSYSIVGPNRGRMVKLMQAYPKTKFSVQADHPTVVKALAETVHAAGLTLDVFLDLDVGQHRTGVAPGETAVELYELIANSPGLRPAGLHVYDGHNHQESAAERETAVKQLLMPVLALRERLEKKGLAVPRIVAGGTPTFSIFAKMDLPGLECSPGTFFLHDTGYGSKFADLAGFVPAALLMTRVISRPTANRVTFDLGYKAVASDPPAGKRLTLLDVPDYTAVLQNEEHLVIETPAADRFQPGDVAFAIPTHICPTCALHRQAYVVENGRVTGTWDIVGRDRQLTV